METLPLRAQIQSVHRPPQLEAPSHVDNPNTRTTQVANKVVRYDFELHYKPGKENKVADALSRIDTATVFAISIPTTTWLKTLRAYYTTNPEGQRLLTKLEQQPSSLPHHTLYNGLVYIQGHLLIPNIHHIRLLLLQEFHTSTLGGHARINATTHRIAASFSWSKLKLISSANVRLAKPPNTQHTSHMVSSNHYPYQQKHGQTLQ